MLLLYSYGMPDLVRRDRRGRQYWTHNFREKEKN